MEKLQQNSKQFTQTVDLTKQLKEVIRKESETWYEFAVIAYEIYRTEEWRKKKYESLKDYIERETENKVSYEIFMHRVKMGETIKKYKLRKEEVIKLGWTKFKELATLALSIELENTELTGLIKEAQDKSYRELQDFVRKERLKRSEKIEQRKVTLKFTLFDEQDNIVKDALETAMGISGLESANHALVYICMEFLMHHTEDNKVINEIKEKVLQLEKKEEKIHKPHANKGKIRKEKQIDIEELLKESPDDSEDSE